jgi:hypothetical protein
MTISTLLLTFDLQIPKSKLYAFRGALIDFVGYDKDSFHNKNNEAGQLGKPIIRYPKIQYRALDKHLQIWAINEGIPALKAIIKNDCIHDFSLEGYPMELKVIKEKETLNFLPDVTKKKHQYRIHQYIPFNDEKFTAFEALNKLTDKIKMLEQLLLNELVLFTYAINWSLSPAQRITTQLLDIEKVGDGAYTTKNQQKQTQKIHYKKVYTLTFETNVDFPDGISLGRHKSVGYGVLQKL